MLKGDGDVEAFKEKLFSSVGTQASYNPGDVVIEAGMVRARSARRTRRTRAAPRPRPLWLSAAPASLHVRSRRTTRCTSARGRWW